MKTTVVLMAAFAALAVPNARADDTAAATRPEKSYCGQVVSVDTKEHTLGVKSWLFSTKQFNLGENCAFVVLGKDNATLADLRPGERITVHYQVAHGVRIADRVEQQPMKIEGMVSAIDTDKHTLVVHRPGLDKPMLIASGCTVKLRNAKTGQLGDIRPGDHVVVYYEVPGDEAVAQMIARTSIVFTGRLTALDLDEKTVKAKGAVDTLKFNLGNQCAIVMNGKTDGKLSDLRPNDRLTFNYETVNGVNVVNRIAPAPVDDRHEDSMLTTTPGGYPVGYPVTPMGY